MRISTRSNAWQPMALLLWGLATTASGSSEPLNTGYNHSVFAPYQAPVMPDQYWINIASFPPTATPVAPSWVLQKPLGWWQPFPLTHWIGARNIVASPPGTNTSNPAYTIFRKCFCLLPNYKNASLSFQVRADDTIQVWVNTLTNIALHPTTGNWNSPGPLSSLPSKPGWFRVGRNCIYVLVEDIGGYMGFNLVGSIQAAGLMPLPALGAAAQFDCPCRGGAAGIASTRARATDEDQAVIQEILRIAEERRSKRASARDAEQP